MSAIGLRRVLSTVVASVSLALLAGTGSSIAAPPPPPPADGGLKPCGMNTPGLQNQIYFGSKVVEAPRPYSTDFTRPDNRNFCSYNVGRGNLRFQPNGLTLHIPSNKQGVNNAEILSRVAFTKGRRSTVRVNADRIRGLNGTVGWGVASRTLEYPQLQVAWFFYNDTNSNLGALTNQLKPLAEHIAGGLPKGFFVMVKTENNLIPRVAPLPMSLLDATHDYAVTATDATTSFAIDGKTVADFPMTLSNTVHVIGYDKPVPLVFQTWVDSNYWFPYPIAQSNPIGHAYRLEQFSEGLIGSTPTKF
ncbi:hypothetical protein HH308_21485 [Gordonia sp. TBRC 11910]|uniref:Glycosyl hydrolase family 16 n=2 Tax=Gordonia asplenii TaxID=2725283 RepID=A0A848KZZ6_9ACTN|nr:hypothetical protein [Gordonia asplenii]